MMEFTIIGFKPKSDNPEIIAEEIQKIVENEMEMLQQSGRFIKYVKFITDLNGNPKYVTILHTLFVERVAE